jgi:group I intron endonuclease
MPSPRKAKRRGVYQIRNLATGLIYVGSSEDLAERWRIHLYQLRTGTHQSKRMLADFQELGADTFVFEVLEETNFDIADLYAREDYWLEKLKPFDPRVGYNILHNTNGNGHKRSEEVCRAISEGRKGMRFTEEHRRRIGAALTGREVSPETGKAISAGRKASPKAKAAILEHNAQKRMLTESEVRKIMLMAARGIFPTAIARELGLTRGVVRAILAGETYTEITGIGN